MEHSHTILNNFRWRAIRLFNSLPNMAKSIRDIIGQLFCFSFKQKLDLRLLPQQ